MHYDAASEDEYRAAWFGLIGRPIIGTTTIGELTIIASMRSWQLTDEHDNIWEGKGRSGEAIREGIRKAFFAWVKSKFHS